MSKVKHPHEVGIDEATAARLTSDWRETMHRSERSHMIGPDGRYSLAELRAAFELVAPFDNWKLPIKAWIAGSMLDVTMKAVEHFAGGDLSVIDVDPTSGRLEVQAPGYYAIIGA
jgi:hypothetical protein